MTNNDYILEIRKAEEKIREMHSSEKNKARLKYWDNAEISSDYFRAIPKDKSIKPFSVECERPQYARILGFDFFEYYHNPYLHYLSGLQMQIFKFKYFDDCTPVVLRQAVYASGAFERSIFSGDDSIYTEHDARISADPVIKEYTDLYKMKYPDFYTSGYMPQILEFYEKIRSIAAPDFVVGFPPWGRSAWGCAWQMRGLENLMFDVYDNPEWVDQLLCFLNESRKSWALQQAEYLGIDLCPTDLFNDEILAPVVSPDLYESKILPLEIDISNFYGGVTYWHSCGDTTQLYSLINQIPNVEMVTVSAWSDVELAGKKYDKDKVLEVQLHNSKHVLGPQSDDDLEKQIRLIKNSTSGHKTNIVAGGLVFYNGFEDGIKRVNKLCETAHRVLEL